METKLESDNSAIELRRDPRAFGDLAESHRHELTVHCYRILGSALDAEDAVQETMLRAYRGIQTFTRDVSFRAWLYKIATNTSLDALSKRRRTLPTLSSPPADPSAPLPDPLSDPVWVEPLPTGSSFPVATTHNPAREYEASETVSLAFVAALQALPPRQRAILILRDVLEFQARDVAGMLDASTSAVNSALHRARSTMKNKHHDSQEQLSAIDDALLERYVQAWESQDVELLVALLREDASLSMPPWPVWYRGHDAILEILSRHVFVAAADRLIKTAANGQPAFAIYRQEQEHGGFTALGVQVLTIFRSGKRIANVDIYLMPSLMPAFGMEPQLVE